MPPEVLNVSWRSTKSFSAVAALDGSLTKNFDAAVLNIKAKDGSP